MKKGVLLTGIVCSIALCAYLTRPAADPIPIPTATQRTGGDSAKGYEYLVSGDYIRSGLPYGLFLSGFGADNHNYLGRTGMNAKIPHSFTAIKAANNEVVVAPNCLQCHAQVFDGVLIVGLGNSGADFTKNKTFNPKNIQLTEKMLKLLSPKSYAAAAAFLQTTKAVTPHLYAPIQGVNVANKLAGVLAAHRDPLTLKWSDTASFTIPDGMVPTDTPPWWNLRKKNAMFYSALGQGDFGRMLMASNLLTVADSSEARQVDGHMPDVLAYIYSLQPPKYPKTIDQTLATKGMALFETKCSGCHGKYGQGESYPNLLIPGSIIKTDSLLFSVNYTQPQLVDWFNRSWFAGGSHPARLVPMRGYIAPPLDGIWITAPYLHNGSVPTLEALLNSKTRPTYWSRSFEKPQYDYENVGWVYTVEKEGGSTSVYDTKQAGYGNGGHYFGDALSDGERKAVIEYLKTL
jgi:hypothetical protein